MTVYFPFVYENILTANNNELSRLALMLIKVNGKKVCGLLLCDCLSIIDFCIVTLFFSLWFFVYFL